ncbi:MAG: hypothetical protein RLY31_1253 [Bacteroidota bacterium]|jgi:hypothetical protein
MILENLLRVLADHCLGLLAAVFVIGGLWAVGKQAIRWFRWDLTGGHICIGLGFALFYPFFFVFAGLFPGQAAYFFYACFAVALGISQAEIRELLRRLTLRHLRFVPLVTFLFLPFLFRLFSPPTNFDGVSFYVPAAQWIHHFGLLFNPYLPNYTTMPQGAEYLFSLSYGLGGIPGILLMDSLFTYLLLDLFLSTARSYLSFRWAVVAVCLALLIPETIFFVFGSGKVDTLGTYLFFLGFTLVLRFRDSRRATTPLPVLSAALAVKYTNWILLALPLAVLPLYLLYRRRYRPAVFAALLPLLFTLPTLFRNQAEVNNPFAPLFLTGKETRFLLTHGSMPDEVVPAPDRQPMTQKRSHTRRYHLLVHLFKRYISHGIVGLLLLTGLIRAAGRLSMPDFWPWYLFLVLSFAPWYCWLGGSPQPLRFLWPFLLVLILFVTRTAAWWLRQLSPHARTWGARSAVAGLLVPLVGYSYYRYGVSIPQFFQSLSMPLPAWYAAIGQDYLAASATIQEQGYHHAAVYYLNDVALSFFEPTDYGNLPGPETLLRNIESGGATRTDETYLFGNLGEGRPPAVPDNLIFRFGDYCLAGTER